LPAVIIRRTAWSFHPHVFGCIGRQCWLDGLQEFRVVTKTDFKLSHVNIPGWAEVKTHKLVVDNACMLKLFDSVA
jgi:hypothetical protein